MSLNADCTTDTTIGVPDGYTLDGKGFTITAVDGPSGTSFTGAVVQNEGTAMNVKNLKIEGGVPNNCVGVFNGVAFMNAGGSIKNVTLNNIGQTTGCQSGRAIFVENTDASPRQSVTIEGNTVWHYNKNGIDVRGNVDATIIGNTVTGNGPIDYIAQNGIVVYGARLRSRRSRATRSAGTTTRPPTRMATGILVIGANVSIDRKNKLSGNEVDILRRWHHQRQEVQRLTTRAAGVATPTPDSPARQLMHRKARSGGPSSFSWTRLDEPARVRSHAQRSV